MLIKPKKSPLLVAGFFVYNQIMFCFQWPSSNRFKRINTLFGKNKIGKILCNLTTQASETKQNITTAKNYN